MANLPMYCIWTMSPCKCLATGKFAFVFMHVPSIQPIGPYAKGLFRYHLRAVSASTFPGRLMRSAKALTA